MLNLQSFSSSRGLHRGQFALLALCLVLSVSGCMSEQQIFTQGRIQDLCNGVVPQCQTQAGCVLDDQHYVQGTFPGDQKVVVHSDARNATLVVRLLLTTEVYPGTELLEQAFDPDCGDASVKDVTNQDLFALAGNQRVLEYHLALPLAGDHLLEVYSDMSADYLMTTQVESSP